MKELYLGVDLSYLPEGALNALKKYGDTSISTIMKEDDHKEEQERDIQPEEKISDSEESSKQDSPISPPPTANLKVVESPVSNAKLVGGKSILTEDIMNTSSISLIRKT